jgi:hypothetical protein
MQTAAGRTACTDCPLPAGSTGLYGYPYLWYLSAGVVCFAPRFLSPEFVCRNSSCDLGRHGAEHHSRSPVNSARAGVGAIADPASSIPWASQREPVRLYAGGAHAVPVAADSPDLH